MERPYLPAGFDVGETKLTRNLTTPLREFTPGQRC
jgi:hypothetical protein